MTWGAAYEIDPEREKEVLSHLDHRERVRCALVVGDTSIFFHNSSTCSSLQAGYTVDTVDVFDSTHEGSDPVLRDVLVFHGTPDNPYFTGLTKEEDTARIITVSKGLSSSSSSSFSRLHPTGLLRHHAQGRQAPTASTSSGCAVRCVS